jgi:hypothetical protein
LMRRANRHVVWAISRRVGKQRTGLQGQGDPIIFVGDRGRARGIVWGASIARTAFVTLGAVARHSSMYIPISWSREQAHGPRHYRVVCEADFVARKSPCPPMLTRRSPRVLSSLKDEARRSGKRLPIRRRFAHRLSTRG